MNMYVKQTHRHSKCVVIRRERERGQIKGV